MPILDPHNKLKKKVVTPKPTVAGATTSPIGGSARGDDFASDYSGSDTGSSVRNTAVSTTARSKSQLKNAKFNLAGSSAATTQAKLREESIARSLKIKEKNQDRRKKMGRQGRLASDNLRASQTDLTSDEATTTQGGRSSRDAKVKSTFTTKNGLKKILYNDGTSEYDETPETYNDKIKLGKLDEIKKKALDVQEKYNTLKNNETSAAESAIASDASVVKDEKAATTSVAEAAKKSPISETLALLDQQMVGIKDQLRNDIQSINQSAKQTKSDTEGKQQQETGQQSVEIANAGGYLGYSGSGQGVMLKLAEGHRAELSALDTARLKAINEAKSAAANRQFDVVKEKAAAIQRIEEAAYDAELKYQANVQEQQAKQAEEEEVLAQQGNILKALEGGAKTPEAIFKALGSSVSFETIDKFLDLASPARRAGDTFSYSKSDVAQFLGSGLSQDDIAVLNETVNELGYSDEVRATLPAAVRVVADKIYREKTGGGGGGSSSGVTVGGRNISSLTTQVLDGFTKISALTPTKQQQVRDDLYTLGFGSDKAPEWFSEDDYPDAPVTKTSAGYTIPSVDALLGRPTMGPSTTIVMPDRNQQWQKFTRNVMNEEDTEDSEVDEVDLIRTQIQARER